jgi:hypothetical protein
MAIKHLVTIFFDHQTPNSIWKNRYSLQYHLAKLEIKVGVPIRSANTRAESGRRFISVVTSYLDADHLDWRITLNQKLA